MEEKLASILKVDNAKWAKEAAGVEEFYKKFGDKLPQELRDELNPASKSAPRLNQNLNRKI